MDQMTFYCSKSNTVKKIVYAIFTPFFVFFLSLFILQFTSLSNEIQETISYVISAIFFLLILWDLFEGRKIKVELLSDGFVYYSRKHKHEFKYEDIEISYKSESSQGTTDVIDLLIFDRARKETFKLDIEPLGYKQFRTIYETIKQKTGGDRAKKLY